MRWRAIFIEQMRLVLVELENHPLPLKVLEYIFEFMVRLFMNYGSHRRHTSEDDAEFFIDWLVEHLSVFGFCGTSPHLGALYYFMDVGEWTLDEEQMDALLDYLVGKLDSSKNPDFDSIGVTLCLFDKLTADDKRNLASKLGSRGIVRFAAPILASIANVSLDKIAVSRGDTQSNIGESRSDDYGSNKILTSLRVYQPEVVVSLLDVLGRVLKYGNVTEALDTGVLYCAAKLMRYEELVDDRDPVNVRAFWCIVSATTDSSMEEMIRICQLPHFVIEACRNLTINDSLVPVITQIFEAGSALESLQNSSSSGISSVGSVSSDSRLFDQSSNFSYLPWMAIHLLPKIQQIAVFHPDDPKVVLLRYLKKIYI